MIVPKSWTLLVSFSFLQTSKQFNRLCKQIHKEMNKFFQWINRQLIEWAYRRYNAQYCFKHQIWKVKNEASCKGTRRIFIYFIKVCFFQKSSSTLYCLNYLHLPRGWSGVINFDFCLGESSVEFCYSQYSEPSSSRNLGQATHF